MRRIQLNSLQLNAVRLNGIGECQRVSHAGAPPVVPDVPDIPEEPDAPSDPDVDENGYIIFADPEVARICAENWGDGTGITLEQAAAVTSIGTVFRGNATITSFNEFGKFTKAQAIPANAFNGCTSLCAIDLSNVTSLGTAALSNCSALEIDDLAMPNLTSLDQNALYGVKVKKISDLGKITELPSGSIYTQNFGDKSYLEEVILPESITSIGYCCFYELSALKNIGVNWNKITRIEESAFGNCTSLEIADLSLPNLTSLGQNAFYGVKVKKISNLGKITELPSGSIYTQNFGDKSYLEEVILPEGLIELPYNCFSGYSKLSNVEWPTTLAKIGDYCFSGCISLPSTLELPYITYIATGAFNEVGIRRVTLPSIETLEFGGNYAGSFAKNDVEFIHLGAECSLIGSYTFSYATGTAPLTMICEAAIPPLLGDSIFHAGNKNFDFIYVPDDSVEAYRTATNWSQYAEKIVPLSDYNGVL